MSEARMDSLSVTELSQVLAKMHSAQAVARAACTCKLWKSAAELAFRELCISTGRVVELDQLPCLAARQRAALSHANELPCSADSEPSSSPAYTDLTMSWQQIYFGQTYALSFNGVNNYATLLNNVLRHTASYHMCDSGYTVDIMFLAHPLHSAAASDTHAAIPGGGMLLGLQDREFGRSRRAARLFSFPMLYIGIDGRLHSAVGVHSPQVVADGQWHRATLTADRNTFFAFLYLDGVAVAFNQHIDAQHACLQDLPRYAILGSGITMGYCSGGSTPVYNCHTLHGLIDEVRLWVRALEAYEIKEIAWRRISSLHDMPYTSAILGSWSFTEGRGGLAWDHLKCNHSMLLGSVTIPSAHHTYGSVSNLVQCLPPEVVASKGPQWVNSTAPVEGDLVVEGHSLSQTSY